jgi:hypothetical protein
MALPQSSTNNAIVGSIQQTALAGFITVDLAKGLSFVYSMYKDIITDYENGDYGALVADGLLSAGALGIAAAAGEEGLFFIAAFELEGLAAVVAYAAVYEIASAAAGSYKSDYLTDAAHAGQILDALANDLYANGTYLVDHEIQAVSVWWNDFIDRVNDGYYDERIKPPPKPFIWPGFPSFHDPLVLDLQGGGLTLTSVTDSPVYFDFTGSGMATETGWITPGEGMLLLNNGSGNLSQELLGAQSGNGFTDLQALDSNGDGVINALDPAFSSLEVWVDRNSNGQVDPGELETLNQLGITSISLATTPVGGNINGNIVVSSSTFSTNGANSGSISEVDFQTSTTHERYVPPVGFDYSPEALLLPQLDGYGYVSDLQVAMSQDSSLLDNVQSLVENASTMSGTDFDTAFQSIMLQWAGVSGVALDAYGADINSQHYAFICAMYGVTPAPQGDWAGIPEATLEGIYSSLINQLELRFASQVAASETALGITPSAADPFAAFAVVNYDPVADTVTANLGLLIGAIVQGAPSDETAAGIYYSLAFTAARGLSETDFGGDTAAFAATLLSNLGPLGVDADLQKVALGAIGLTSILDHLWRIWRRLRLYLSRGQ